MTVRDEVDCPACGAQAGQDCIYPEAETKGHPRKGAAQLKRNHEARQRKWWKTRGIKKDGAVDDLSR